MREQIENNLLCVIQQVNDLQARAERAEALLADERERVKTLQRELDNLNDFEKAFNIWAEKTDWVDSGIPHDRKAGLRHRADLMRQEIERLRTQIADLERRVPTEETVQAIVKEFWRCQMKCTSDANLGECLRRNLLLAQPAPQPQPEPSTVIEFCMRTDEAKALKRIGEKQELTEQQVLRQALRLYETTVFPVESTPKLQPAPQPEPKQPDDGWRDWATEKPDVGRRVEAESMYDLTIKGIVEANAMNTFVRQKSNNSSILWGPSISRWRYLPDTPPQTERDDVIEYLTCSQFVDLFGKNASERLCQILRSERSGRKGVTK